MKRSFLFPALVAAVVLSTLCIQSARADFIWIEGEKPSLDKMNRHPWWYDQVKREQFSGGDFTSNFHEQKAGEAEYEFEAPRGGAWEFWVRANPLQAALSYTLNGGAETAIELGREKRDEINVAADGKPDLRFLAWSRVGRVELKQGKNRIRFRMTSANHFHGYLDCFVFSTEPIAPRAALKPDQMAEETRKLAEENKGWIVFDPPRDAFAADTALDLRFLNEKQAGDGGPIVVKDGQFVHSATGEPVRFWAVNGPPPELEGEALRRCARMLAKHGVNLVRVHGALFDQDGEVDPAKVRHARAVVEAMKAEGIYTHFSIYFPLWFTPRPGHPWLEGYDGKTHPFAALLFNQRFQEKHREWIKALLEGAAGSGVSLGNDPAVFGLEIQNEDSFFFWTFDAKNIPDPQLRLLEGMFGKWLEKKYGSVEKALVRWNGLKLDRDAPADGRPAFRPLWNLFNERRPRDQDTAAFLLDQQTRFYRETTAYVRGLGFKGLVCASNWITASPEILGPLEKLSYTTGDFIDRHGYFSCNHQGDNAAWSVREGHTWSDRSAYRFDNEKPGQPRVFSHPGFDPHYNNLPSMISEIAWCRPNRFRGEAPVFLSAYGCLQHSDAIVQFALDGPEWTVKPNFWMQPWTIMTPTTMGQFPAAALIFRRGLIAPGEVVADVKLGLDDLRALQGTPLPQDAALDELRLRDVPTGASSVAARRIHPLAHCVGRTNISFVDGASSVRAADLTRFIDTKNRLVRSSHGQLVLDYGRGVLTLDAPAVQGVSGALSALGGPVETRDLVIESPMEIGHLLVVALDGADLTKSKRILLQVMSEEKESGRSTEEVSPGVRRISALGADPWLVKEFRGTVKLKWPGAARLKATPLDANGMRAGPSVPAAGLVLRAETLYYLIEE